MELVSNQTADFTRWVTGTGLLHEPFVIVDVGVQGGENLRWHALGDHLILHGFDAIEAVVEQLQSANRRPNVTYHCMALGNADGNIELFINEADLYSSSMYRHGESRFERRDPRLRTQQVPIRRLDGLIQGGSVPPPDFLKVDVEGFEGEVLLGSARHLDGLCGFEVESNFGISTVYPNTHFGLMMETALTHRLLVFDLEFNRVPTITFQEALAHKDLDQVHDHISIGKPATLNVLFARDLIQEADNPEVYQAPRVGRLANGVHRQRAGEEVDPGITA
jgi:FkbM family methyltransferase